MQLSLIAVALFYKDLPQASQSFQRKDSEAYHKFKSEKLGIVPGDEAIKITESIIHTLLNFVCSSYLHNSNE